MFAERATGDIAAGAATGSTGAAGAVGVTGAAGFGATTGATAGATAAADAADEVDADDGVVTVAGADEAAGAEAGEAEDDAATEAACGADAAIAPDAVACPCTGSIAPASAVHSAAILARPESRCRRNARANPWVENRMLISDRPPFLDEFSPDAAQQVGLTYGVATVAFGAHGRVLGDVEQCAA